MLQQALRFRYCQNNLKENVMNDITNLLNHMDEDELIEQIKEYSIPRNIATNTISDVLGGYISKKRPIFYGHKKVYWQIPGKQEFFAHYCSLLAFRDITKLFPHASKVCDNILKEVIKEMKKK